MNEKELTPFFYRGIANVDYLSGEQVLPDAFIFKTSSTHAGYKEMSITWDDEGSVDFLKSERKENGKVKYPAGIAKLNHQDTCLALKNIENLKYSFIREPTDDNPAHGEAFINEDLSKGVRLLVMSAFALSCVEIIPNKQTEICANE